ncbi:helicase-related protein [Acinetobacter indicus]|uniref:helicase-related protein n=1 Tax=Acinetobacter indicus TaxID=756892 RepID=UPI00148EB1AA|nr:helicase-related protein [Acinetobacter indicus]
MKELFKIIIGGIVLLIDNKTETVSEKLKQIDNTDATLSMQSNKFTIYAFDALRKELTTIKKSRILLSQSHWDMQSLVGCEKDTSLINQLGQKRIALKCLEWLNKSHVEIATHSRAAESNNIICIEKGDALSAIYGDASFSPEGLGEIPPLKQQMITYTDDALVACRVLEWFKNLWDDKENLVHIKKEIVKRIETLTEDQPLESIYLLTLFNIFSNFLGDLDQEKLLRSKTGFKDSIVWNKLFKFQKDGVVGAIEKLEKFNGCIIADSVGLGKTFEALAVIKYYELRNDRVLVLCPKKLRDNWTMYTINDKRNILAEDRFNYDVLNHTDLTRTKGFSSEINLETLNWANYDLVVIDESHNFRNTPTKVTGNSRYEKLLNDVLRAGVKTKVLMLSATPVNNRMNDLKNQIAFITEGRDVAFIDQGIKSIERTLMLAQKQFNQWVKLPVDERTTANLLDSMSFDYFKLLDIVTIARSRKHIEKYYGVEDIGKFPERLKPKNIYADLDLKEEFPPLKEVNKTIRRLTLAGYSPLKYVRNDKKDEYSRKYDKAVGGGKGVFKQIDREESLIHLMRVNLLKRMESSIHSFTLTVAKLVNQVTGLLDKIEKLQHGDIQALNIEDIQDIEFESAELEPYLIGNKTKVLLQDMDLIRFKQDLAADQIFLTSILQIAQEIDISRDAKLHKLKQEILFKVQNPINTDNKKLIVFTAFADTAEYLYKELSSWGVSALGIHSALITGSGSNKTTLKDLGTDLNTLLTAFSPISKERNKTNISDENEIDLLIATDCISEGQNLQDCDTLINYDIHWNPVRIIQRFGRIDRLGSKNTQIQLINFWPNMELDEYINLEAKVSGRMVLLDISATGEENVIDPNNVEMNDLEYRKKQLQQLKDAVVDLEDMAGGISLTDLTLNDFRLDLSNYLNTPNNLQTLEAMPFGLFSAVSIQQFKESYDIPKGIIFCLKSLKTGKDALQISDHYPLHPYFLVHVSFDLDVVHQYTQLKQILDIFKLASLAKAQVDQTAYQHVNVMTKQEQDTTLFKKMLVKAIESIEGKSEEKGIESLFHKGGTVLSASGSQNLEDFTVVSYLVITD